MESKKIVVVVEDVEAARTALRWALHNLCRYGDVITLLHVYSCSTRSRSKRNTRMLRLKGFQLALSFKDICSTFLNTNVEIIVTEGDEDGGKIAAMVRDIGSSTLVVGLHDRSFLYKLAMDHHNVASNFNCKVLAIRQPAPPRLPRSIAPTPPTPDSTSNSLDFSQIDIARLEPVELPTPKVPYKVCPDPYAILWRWRKKSRWKRSP